MRFHRLRVKKSRTGQSFHKYLSVFLLYKKEVVELNFTHFSAAQPEQVGHGVNKGQFVWTSEHKVSYFIQFSISGAEIKM